MDPHLPLQISVYAFAALLTLGTLGIAYLTTYAQIETGRLPRRRGRSSPRKNG